YDGGVRECFAEHGSILDGQGIWTPVVSQLGQRWKERGWYQGRHPLTEEELVHGVIAAQQALASLTVEASPAAKAAVCTTRQSEGKMNEASSPILIARELSYARKGQCVLQHISLELYSGELVAIVGPNGAGKTTLSHALAGLLQKTEGQVL